MTSVVFRPLLKDYTISCSIFSLCVGHAHCDTRSSWLLCCSASSEPKCSGPARARGWSGRAGRVAFGLYRSSDNLRYIHIILRMRRDGGTHKVYLKSTTNTTSEQFSYCFSRLKSSIAKQKTCILDSLGSNMFFVAMPTIYSKKQGVKGGKQRRAYLL
jgi:hypothetical protein